jgi:hypothetical protein
LSKAEVRAAYDAAVETARGVLEGLAPSQLMQQTDRTGKTTTFAQLLLHVSHHNADHVGQIVWITKMLRPGAVQEIWMRARARPAD